MNINFAIFITLYILANIFMWFSIIVLNIFVGNLSNGTVKGWFWRKVLRAIFEWKNNLYNLHKCFKHLLKIYTSWSPFIPVKPIVKWWLGIVHSFFYFFYFFVYNYVTFQEWQYSGIYIMFREFNNVTRHFILVCYKESTMFVETVEFSNIL